MSEGPRVPLLPSADPATPSTAFTSQQPETNERRDRLARASTRLAESSEFKEIVSDPQRRPAPPPEAGNDDMSTAAEKAGGSMEPDREFLFGAGADEKYGLARSRGEEVQLDSFPDNSIKTSRYTWYNFLPRNLLEQFRRIANFYFLIMSILMLVGYNTNLYVSSLSGWTTLGTLLLVVLVTMYMSLRDDLNRHERDKEVNFSQATVLTSEHPTGISRDWRDLGVGDLVLVRKDSAFPADLVTLGSSNEDNLCYVETKNIDGESNLKVRNTIPEMQEYLVANGTAVGSACQRAVTVQGTLSYEPPNNSIYTFNGFVDLTIPSVADRISLGGRNLLLRGSTLRNTRWAIGLVVYTGKDTKVVRNSRETPAKMSMIEKVINKTLWVILLIQLAFAIICDVLFNNFDAAGGNTAWYLSGPNASTTTELLFPNWLAYVFTFLILFNNLVPISLYVTVEFCNAFQAGLINRDKKMVDPSTGMSALCRSTNLCQELGQIEYVFSDKTGTLTQNIMTFKSLSVGGTVYSDEGPGTEDSDFQCGALKAALSVPGEQQDRLRQFFEVLCVAHTVVVEQFEEDEVPAVDAAGGDGGGIKASSESKQSMKDTNQPDEGDGISYQAESPDELAFVESAAAMGYVFTKRVGPELHATIDGVDKVFTICAVNEFNSTRKRQSCVVRTPEGKVMLFCKGADNVMFERADKTIPGQTDYIEKLNQDLYDFACKGLRTLVMASRELSEEEFTQFMTDYDAANAALVGRKEKLVELAERVERDMIILGVSAIEDKLQDKVADCISSLHKAKIKLWVLTGDKLETAINIGFSCKVLLPTMKIVKIRCTDDSDVAKARMLARFQATLRQVDAVLNRGEGVPMSDVRKTHEAEDEDGQPDPLHTITREDVEQCNIALVITGESLHAIMANEDQKSNLLRLTESCSVVIGCRVSPAQKAQMVKMVQQGYMPNPPVTLAIGDGANDVPMIQQAQVGVGVQGREGRQAVNSSDFAISQFKHLERLLIVHGRWNYRRICKVILYSFYKNITLTLVIFFYTFYTGFSGTSLFEATSYMLFNVCFCSLPIIAVGWFDKDMSEETVLAYPEMYISGRLGQDLNIRAVIQVVVFSIVHALVLFYIPYVAYDGFLNNGIGDQLSYGTVSFSSLVLVMNVRVAFITHTWNWIVHFFLWGSVVFYILFLIVLSVAYSYSAEYYFVAIECFGTPLFWTVCLSCMLTVLLIDIVVENFRLQFMPNLVDIGREIDNDVSTARQRKLLKQTSSYLLDSSSRNSSQSSHASSTDPIQMNKKTVTSFVDSAISRAKASTVVHTTQGDNAFIYEQNNPAPNECADIANDDNLDEAAELRGGRQPSSNGFNFDYAEGSDEHYGTQARRLTATASLRSQMARVPTANDAPKVSSPPPGPQSVSPEKESASATVANGTGSTDKDVENASGALLKHVDEDTDDEEEQELTKCGKMGIDIMNQSLPAWQPVILVKWMATTLLIMGTLFLLIGIPAVVECLNSNEHKVWYGGVNSRRPDNSTEGDSVFCVPNSTQVLPGNFTPGLCYIDITIKETMPGPVYVMYEIDGLFQNYYSYGQSRSYAQTHGSVVTAQQLETDCGKGNYVNTSGARDDGNYNLTYAPCGLVAHSFFNDSFAVNPSSGLSLDETNIAWKSDVTFLFQNPDNWKEYRDQTTEHEFLYQSYGESSYRASFYDHNYESEHFAVWMRAAAFPKFKKPFGTFQDGITVAAEGQPLTLRFTVENYYNVDQFNGSKALTLHTKVQLGGAQHQPIYAWMQVALGGVSLLIAVGMLLQQAICPRNIKKRAMEMSIHYERSHFVGRTNAVASSPTRTKPAIAL